MSYKVDHISRKLSISGVLDALISSAPMGSTTNRLECLEVMREVTIKHTVI